MFAENKSLNGISRRAVSIGLGLGTLRLIMGWRVNAMELQTPSDRFGYLSTHGNSNCSAAFLDSIATMAPTARLQGSCCSPMNRHRYHEQVQGLKKYRLIPEIPPDPYDIAAGGAQRLLPFYDLALSTAEQQAYQLAMENSDEKGPCCCGCWRWKVYGGLGKYLIRDHRFDGNQVADVWHLSDGCGGGAEHRHG